MVIWSTMADEMFQWSVALIAIMGFVLMILGVYIVTKIQGFYYIGIAASVGGVGLISLVMSRKKY